MVSRRRTARIVARLIAFNNVDPREAGRELAEQGIAEEGLSRT